MTKNLQHLLSPSSGYELHQNEAVGTLQAVYQSILTLALPLTSSLMLTDLDSHEKCCKADRWPKAVRPDAVFPPP